MQVDHNGLGVLDRAQCLDLLSTAAIGRVGLSIRALPVILPVNFAVVDERIMFRTGAGTKLRAATVDAVVAFQADGHDVRSRSGWSVLVQGVSTLLTKADENRSEIEQLVSWGTHETADIVVIATTMVSGRLIPGADTQQGDT